MVKEMLLEGESIAKIKKYSKLSEEEITKIQKNNAINRQLIFILKQN